MKTTIKISNDDIRESIGIEEYEFPKYATQILNLANQDAQGTRPNIVGQMSDLIQEFNGRTVNEWEQWYSRKYPDAISNATEKVFVMVENFKEVIHKIDRQMVMEWVKDLVITKTFVGFRFQETILMKVASVLKRNFRTATPTEESKGIDGYIGSTPVSIKPSTYKSQRLTLSEEIKVGIIYYEKTKTGLNVEYDIL